MGNVSTADNQCVLVNIKVMIVGFCSVLWSDSNLARHCMCRAFLCYIYVCGLCRLGVLLVIAGFVLLSGAFMFMLLCYVFVCLVALVVAGCK